MLPQPTERGKRGEEWSCGDGSTQIELRDDGRLARPDGRDRSPPLAAAGAAVGEDNEYVFGELLGMSGEEIRRAIEAGAIESGEER